MKCGIGGTELDNFTIRAQITYFPYYKPSNKRKNWSLLYFMFSFSVDKKFSPIIRKMLSILILTTVYKIF